MANPQGYPHYDYSTLEVDPNQQHLQPQPQTYDNGGNQQYQAVGQNDNQEWAHTHSYPQVAYSPDPQAITQDKSNHYPEPVPGQPEVPPQMQQVNQYGQPWPEQTAAAGAAGAAAPGQGAQAGSTILGLKRRTFYVVLAVLIVVIIGAVVGGAVGGTVGKKNKDTSAPGPSTSSSPGGDTGGGGGSNVTVMSNSSLSAINWTDAQNHEYRAVFWQAKTTHLMMSLWDSENKTWEVTNISSTISAQLQAGAGTALSAAVRAYPWTQKQFGLSFSIVLFYLSPANVVQQLYSSHPRGATWQRGSLIDSNLNLQASHGSQIAMWWSLCYQNCTNEIWMLYEDANQNIMFATGEPDDDDNVTSWPALTKGAWVSNIVSQSGLTMAPIAPDNKTWGADPSSPRMYYDTAGSVQEVVWHPEIKTWYFASIVFQDLPAVAPELASIGYLNSKDKYPGPRRLMLGARYDNGTVGLNYWNASAWHGQTFPDYQGKSFDKWSAMTLLSASDLKFFGLTDGGEIHAYTIDKDTPSEWTYDEQVATSKS